MSSTQSTTPNGRTTRQRRVSAIMRMADSTAAKVGVDKTLEDFIAQANATRTDATGRAGTETAGNRLMEVTLTEADVAAQLDVQRRTLLSEAQGREQMLKNEIAEAVRQNQAMELAHKALKQKLSTNDALPTGNPTNSAEYKALEERLAGAVARAQLAEKRLAAHVATPTVDQSNVRTTSVVTTTPTKKGMSIGVMAAVGCGVLVAGLGLGFALGSSGDRTSAPPAPSTAVMPAAPPASSSASAPIAVPAATVTPAPAAPAIEAAPPVILPTVEAVPAPAPMVEAVTPEPTAKVSTIAVPSATSVAAPKTTRSATRERAAAGVVDPFAAPAKSTTKATTSATPKTKSTSNKATKKSGGKSTGIVDPFAQ